MFLVFGSLKGSPGVSCLTAGVAACLRVDTGSRRLSARTRRVRSHDPRTTLGTSSIRPEGPVLVWEADPSGGVFAGRAGLDAHPGMASLAARTRGGVLSAETVASHSQVLPSGAGVVVGPIAGDEASSGLEVLAESVVRFARSRPETEVHLADVGRLNLDSAAAPFVWSADGVVLVAWADREGLAHAAAWLRGASELAARVAIVARQPAAGAEYTPQEIANALGVQVLARLPDDSTAAQAFTAGPPRSGGPRGRWWRSIRQIAEHVSPLAMPVAGDAGVGVCATPGGPINWAQEWGSDPT
jgi:hypothetical protein